MGTLIRGFDWADTPLGPFAAWPQSLRTAVAILLSSRHPMFVAWGPRLTFIYNDAYAVILGSKHPAGLGAPFEELWADVWPDVSPLVERALAGEPTWSDDMQLFMDRAGYLEETYFTFSYSPVQDESGRVGGIFCAVIETTQRVLADRRVHTLHDLGAAATQARTVADAEALCARALEANPHDVPFALLYRFEDRTARLVGKASVAAGPDAPAVLQLDDADGRWPMARASRGWPDAVGDSAVIFPLMGRRDDAAEGALVLGVSPRRALDAPYRSFLEYVAGGVTAALANARAYEEEKARAEELAALDRAKTAFFSNVSHEFRTPLTLLLGPLEEVLTERRGPLSPAQREALEVARRNSLRLLRLVNTLLDFARIEAGRAQAVFAPTDLAILTAELASAFRSAVERAGLRLTVDTPPLAEPVWVDRDMWEKIVLNLLSNAFKFTLEGEIAVSLRALDDAVELAVSDTGSGIPPEELPRIFERFHQVKGAHGRTHEGTGIGLALVQELVRLHGGEVTVASSRGEGSSFRVRIPRGNAHLPADRIGARDDLESTATGATPYLEEALRWLDDGDVVAPGPARTDEGRARVVLADDNADMREYVERLLSPHYDVEAVADGAAALAAVRREPADLVLADVMMPRLDGFGLLRALRAGEETRALPVLLLSARAGEEASVEGLRAGADDYLVKPFSARELLARVKSHIEGARARSAAVRERNRLRSLLGQVPAITNFLRGPELVFEYVHPLANEVLGGRDVLGKPLLEALPEFRDREFPTLLRSVLETGEAVTGREKVVHHDDGEGGLRTSYWNFVYLPVRGEDGTIEGVMTFDLDVTDQVLARQGLESARAEADRANRVKSEFLAAMSHELRTPLNAILGYSDLLTAEIAGPITPGQAAQLNRIDAGARHLLQLIEEILSFSRVEAGREEAQLARVDLAELAREACTLVEPLAVRKQLRIVCAVPDRLEAHTDGAKVRQILLNLLSNSIKFTERGEIGLELDEDGGHVRLGVTDTGIGIDPEHLGHIFEPFSQIGRTGPARTEGGTGLGLTVSKSLAELLGGEITVASVPGQGSTFTVRFPSRR